MRCVRGVCNYINRFSFLISWLYKLYILDIEHWFTVSTLIDALEADDIISYMNTCEWVYMAQSFCWDWWSLSETRWFAGLGQLQMFVTTKLQNGVFFWFTNQAFKSSILFTAQHRHKEQAIPKISDIEKLKKVRVMKVSVSC